MPPAAKRGQFYGHPPRLPWDGDLSSWGLGLNGAATSVTVPGVSGHGPYWALTWPSLTFLVGIVRNFQLPVLAKKKQSVEGPGKSVHATCLFKERETWILETRSEPRCPAQCVIGKGGLGEREGGWEGEGGGGRRGWMDGWVKDKQEWMNM